MQADNLIALAEQIKTSCESQADGWMERLDNGLTGFTVTQKLSLRNALIDVCKKGGDLDHIFGSSTTVPGLVAVNTSFAQALKGLTGNAPFTENYNPWLLSTPYPYAPKAQLTENVISNVDENICNCCNNWSRTIPQPPTAAPSTNTW